MYVYVLINYNVIPCKTDFLAQNSRNIYFLTEDITLYHALI